MIITGDDAHEILRLQKQLSTEFEMQILGGLRFFLDRDRKIKKRHISFLNKRRIRVIGESRITRR